MLKKILAILMSLALSSVSGTTGLDETLPEVLINSCQKTEVNIKMVGDALIHGNLYKQSKQKDGTYNADKLFENVKDIIEKADLAIINQETILVDKESDYSSYPTFGSPHAIGQAELNAGFDIIAHATNHTLDKKVKGVEQTLKFWSDKDATVLGIHGDENEADEKYVTCNNIKFGFVNYTYGLNGLDSYKKGKDYVVDMLSDKDIEETMKRARDNSEVLIAILHVGDEYVYEPSKYAQKQVDRFIDLGADIVLCAHPHVVECYGYRTTSNGNRGLVYYSLGNFVSSQDKVPRMIGGMADITIEKTSMLGYSTIEIKSYDMIPLVTHLQSGEITTYLLDDYTDKLCEKHKLFKGKYDVNDLRAEYEKYLAAGKHLVTEE